jgi:hypothetical protein
MSPVRGRIDAVNVFIIHRRNEELPACFFNKEYEKTYDRSIANFIRMHKK